MTENHAQDVFAPKSWIPPNLFQSRSQIPMRIQPALVPLLEAIDYANQIHSDNWEFAVELELLVSLGLTRNDFRWLVLNGLVEHKREVTLESDNGRAFRPTGNLVFPAGTCFVLTEKGVLLSGQTSEILKINQGADSRLGNFDARMDSSINDCKSQTMRCHIAKTVGPCWNSERRVLTLNETIVKRFKWVAENQEAVLSVFEEEHWPYRIDDPLKPCPEQNTKRRLSDTIKCLNRKQSSPLIHFRGDGTGEGVLWEVVSSPAFPGEREISTKCKASDC